MDNANIGRNGRQSRSTRDTKSREHVTDGGESADSRRGTKLDDGTKNRERTNEVEKKEEAEIDLFNLAQEQEKKESANPIRENIEEAEAQTDTNPTEAQKQAGNYKKGHVKINGHDITIEHPKGSVRSGIDKMVKHGVSL